MATRLAGVGAGEGLAPTPPGGHDAPMLSTRAMRAWLGPFLVGLVVTRSMVPQEPPTTTPPIAKPPIATPPATPAPAVVTPQDPSGKPVPPTTNRLANEASPYLRQHQLNPVDWHPWGPAAFAAAKAQQKPIFLSIGYSACHWCHVMAHESVRGPADVAKH